MLNTSSPEIHVLTTSKCNLRCIYCGISGEHTDSSQHIDMDEKILSKIITILSKEDFVKNVTFSGGEVTNRKDWMEITDRFIKVNCQVNAILNLQRILKDSEVSFLMNFSTLLISIDSANRSILAETRLHSKLEHISLNIIKLKSEILRSGSKTNLRATSVIGTRNFEQLTDLLYYLKILNFEQLNISDVTPLENIDTGFTSIFDSAEFNKEKINKIIENIIDVTHKLKIDVVPEQFFLQRLSGNFSSTVPQGYTRNCSDPWDLILFKPNGDIHTCCIDYPPIANVFEVNSISDIFNSPKNLICREKLTVGDLSKQCDRCARKEIIPISPNS
jgi:sulfatase maturation enzyme AslB (radical SAM superfamily)